MKTIEEVLELHHIRIDRPTLESYISRQWLRPIASGEVWYFEEVDIARLQLVCHLAQDIEVNDDGVDVVLSLLDQYYSLRAQMQSLTHAIAQQPPNIHDEIMAALQQHLTGENAS
jgi:chaperone modulatory protein CbpM